MQVNHKNGVKTDNRPENLEIVTPEENIRHEIVNGLGTFKGEAHKRAKLKDHQIREIREIQGQTLKQMAARYGIAYTQIQRIRKRESWKHIA